MFTDLARVRDGVRSKRISSFDRTGGNNDRLERIPEGRAGPSSRLRGLE